MADDSSDTAGLPPGDRGDTREAAALPRLALGDLIGEGEAAALLGLQVQTLRNWRWAGKPPKYRKIGRCVRYHRADLAAFANGEV